MEYISIAIIALLASGLTFFSGFGLGTILLPAFGLFFPIEIAIAMTAVVHFLNNIFKLSLVYKNINQKVLVSFGIPALCFAILGAFVLKKISFNNVIYKWNIENHEFKITYVKLIIGLALIFFSLFEIIPKLKNLKFDKKYLTLGGILSGFFGGLSGLQGALRSAFISKIGLSKEQFVATGVGIACLIDISRLGVYSNQILRAELTNKQINIILVAVLFAFTGAYFGSKLVKKVTIDSLQKIVASMLIIFGILLTVGIL